MDRIKLFIHLAVKLANNEETQFVPKGVNVH